MTLSIGLLPALASAGQRSATAADAPAVPRVKVSITESGHGAPALLQYDNNTPFQRRGTDGGTVGNLFDTHPAAHSINSASFRIAGNYDAVGPTGQMVMTHWDQNPGSFMMLRRTLLSGIPANPIGGTMNLTMFTAMAPFAVPIVGHTGAFVGGLRNTDYGGCVGNTMLNSTCDGVALTMGGVDPGFGFNGHRVPFNSNAFVPTMIVTVAGVGTAIAGQNAIFRVTGDNLPVELMHFGVE